MKRVITDIFEPLEQLGKTTAKQVVQQPKKMAEEAVSVVAGKTEEEVGSHLRGVNSKSGKPKLTQAQIAQKIEEAAQMRSRLHLQEIEEQISEIQRERLEQIKRVQEEVFKEKEEEGQKGPQEAQLPSKRKRGLLSTSVKRLKQKVEGWRGAKG